MTESDRAQPAEHRTRWPMRLGSAGAVMGKPSAKTWLADTNR